MRLFNKDVKKHISALYDAEIEKEVEKLPVPEEVKKAVLASYVLTDAQKRSIIKSYLMDRKKAIIYAKSDEDRNILIEKKGYYYAILTTINNFNANQAVAELQACDVEKYQKLIDAIDAELSSTTFISSETKEHLLGMYDKYLARLGTKSTKIHIQRKSNPKTIRQENLFDDEDYRAYSLNKLANKGAFSSYFEIPADDFLGCFTLNKGNNKLNKEGYYTSLQLFIESGNEVYKKVFDRLVNGNERISGNKLKFSFESFRYNKANNTFEISNDIKAI